MAETPEIPPGETPPEEVFESQLESIKIKLQSFEGPLDLLVHLIKKHKVNVYDIPIALITKQYLEYLGLMQELNLDLASEFLVMAATLIHIKSKMLLPRPETAAGDPTEEEDPRDALVRRLLEHEKFKAAAELLHDRETLRNAQWARPDSRIEEIAGDGLRARSRGRSLQPPVGVQDRARARSRAAARACSRRNRFPSRSASSSCSGGSPKPTRAVSRTSSTTWRRAAT